MPRDRERPRIRLERPYAISEVAAMAGWTYKRMKLHLLRLNEQLHGMLLKPSVGANRRYTVTLSALRRACPEMFEDSRNLTSEVEEIRSNLETMRADIQDNVVRINVVARQVGHTSRALFSEKKRRPMSPNVDPKSARSAHG